MYADLEPKELTGLAGKRVINLGAVERAPKNPLTLPIGAASGIRNAQIGSELTERTGLGVVVLTGRGRGTVDLIVKENEKEIEISRLAIKTVTETGTVVGIRSEIVKAQVDQNDEIGKKTATPLGSESHAIWIEEDGIPLTLAIGEMKKIAQRIESRSAKAKKKFLRLYHWRLGIVSEL